MKINLLRGLIAILTALMLLCAAGAAAADMDIPDFDDMPGVVLEDEEITVDESAFEGEWELYVAFAGTEYVTPEILFDTYDYNFMPFVIGNGVITQDLQNENGEFVTIEMPYEFDAGQLQSKDRSGRDFVVISRKEGHWTA